MKKMMLIPLLLLALFALSGCDSVQQALGRLGDDLEAAALGEAKPGSGGDIDWGFVPVVREMAVNTFTQGFPDAEVLETSVACKNSGADRVIVTITYKMDGRSGKYGFDYTLTESGEYELTRYGDGVDSNDL